VSKNDDPRDRPAVLIVDDRVKLCRSLAQNFEHFGFSAAIATNGREAVTQLRTGGADVVLLDIMLGEESGVDVLKSLLAVDASVPVIMITAYASVETAVQSLKLGAFDYVKKPLDFDELLKTVEKACQFSRLREENVRLRGRLRELSATIITRDPRMRALLATVEKLAATDMPVLVCGESGTGKEVIADYLHAASARSAMPMVKINCVAFPESLLDNELFGHERGAYTGADAVFKGVFEKAHGSTLFLDEIGDMPLGIQAKILRTLQNREIRRLGGSQTVTVDVRFLAATNKDLGELMARGLFREDLYYRLNAAVLSLPPLRERRDDIALLADFFLRKVAREAGKRVERIAPEALALLTAYPWPGNVRELEHAIERAVILTQNPTLLPADLPPELQAPPGGRPAPAAPVLPLREVERRHLLFALERAQGNRKRAAEWLGITRRTLYRMAARYGIKISEPKN